MQTEETYPDLKSGKIPRSFWYSITFVATYSLVLGIFMFLHQGDTSPSFLFISSMSMLLAIIASFVLSLIGIKRHKRHDKSSRLLPQRSLYLWSPLMMNIALLGQCIGNALFGYELASSTYSFPSLADIVVLTIYPTFILSIWFLPTHSLLKKDMLRFLLDGFIMIVILLTFSWYFLVGPLLLLPGQSLLVKIAHITYPTGELLMISCLILFTVNVSGKLLRLIVILLFTGLMAYLLSEVVRQYLFIHALPPLLQPFPWWTMLGWIDGSFFFALSAQIMHCLPYQNMHEDLPSHKIVYASIPLWRIFLPYVFIPAVIALVFYVGSTGSKTSLLSLGTYVCALLLLALIFIRQIIILRESHQLNLHLRVANDRLEALATTDPLTELPNHRALMTALTNEMERAERFQRSCTLLFFDLDHFKALNDGYGHAAGDEALAAFGQQIRQSARRVDTVGRWGGEEFLAILPETTVQEAQDIAERIRIAVGDRLFDIGGGLHLTCSLGVACYPIHATTLNDLVNAADQAMYAAKRLGRNQYRVIDDPIVQLILISGASEGGREETATDGIIMALISLMKQYNTELAEHSSAVAELAEQLAVHVGIPAHEAHMISLAAILHDIGKIGIPDAILQEHTPLTSAELQKIQQHPAMGAEIVAHIPALRPLAPVIRAHHEWWNGKGYPDHLQGENIPLAARLISVANAYQTMLSDHPYQQTRSSEDVLKELQNLAGTQFDQTIVEALVTLLHEQVQCKITASVA